MTVEQIALLGASGLMAGLVNAVAGGGTFFTFSALVAAGLPPIAANATSAVAVWPGSIASAVAYWREMLANWRHFLPLAIISLAGGAVGAVALLLLEDAEFSATVPWLLLLATVLFAASPRITALMKARAAARPPAAGAGAGRTVGAIIQFLVAIYGGFFGAGMGILMLAALAIVEGDDFHRINAAKVLLSILINGIAIILFVASGIVYWGHALVVMATCIAGGYLGVVLAKRVPIWVVRWFVVAVGALLTVWFFAKAYL